LGGEPVAPLPPIYPVGVTKVGPDCLLKLYQSLWKMTLG
jgi:hypothetical protein